jgi:hypothetical protein
MPSPHKVLIALRGTEEYARFLDRLQAKVRKAGASGDTLTDLAELALAELAERHGVKAPKRAGAVGTNQHGEPAPD